MYKIQNLGWRMHCKHHDPFSDLGNFIHGSAEDPVTRVMSSTALVLALAQAAGPAMLRQPPGFLLINSSGEPIDPIDAVIKNLTGMESPRQRPEAEAFERSLRTMEVALKIHATSPRPLQIPSLPHHGMGGYAPRPLPDPYQDALFQAFGDGRVRLYADAHNERFGWASCDSSKHLILRLDRDEDRLRLRHDLRQRPEILIHPQGFGTSMRSETKALSFAGCPSD